MPRTSMRRTTLLLLLAAFLAAPWAAWAGSPRSVPRPTELTAWDGLDLLRRLWDQLTSVWSGTGANIDPGGGHAPSTPAAPSDEGSNIDPGGGRAPSAPAAPTDEGSNIDPSGGYAQRTRPTAPVDEGCNIDPDGCASRIARIARAVPYGETGSNIDPNGYTG